MKLGRWEGIVEETWILAKGMESEKIWGLSKGQKWSSLVIYWKGSEGEGAVRDDTNVLAWATELTLVLFIDVEDKGGGAGLSVTTNSVWCTLYMEDCILERWSCLYIYSIPCALQCDQHCSQGVMASIFVPSPWIWEGACDSIHEWVPVYKW